MRAPARVAQTGAVLTAAEAAELERCEAWVQRGIDMVGKALESIRDGRLYRATHATFEAYCRERWGRSRSWAQRQIAAAVFSAEHPDASEAELRAIASGRAAPFAADSDSADPTEYRLGVLRSLASGAVDGLPSDISGRVVGMSAEARESLFSAAREALESVESGSMPLGRAYAGIVGKLAEQRGKAMTRHFLNARLGIVKTRSFEHWDDLDAETGEPIFGPRQREEIFQRLAEAVNAWPAEVRRALKQLLRE